MTALPPGHRRRLQCLPVASMKTSIAILWLAGWVLGVALGTALPIRGEGEPAAKFEPSAAPLQSGLKVGEKVPTFYVRAITGPLKNKSVCYVCRNGDRPVVMLFIRQITPELKRLLKGIDGEVDQHRASGLRSFGVFLAGDNKELLPQV